MTSRYSLTITDPLVLYRQFVDSGRIKPDEAQHRAAMEFQKLYLRVKDYMPEEDFKKKIDKLAVLLQDDATNKGGVWYSPRRKSLELIKVLSDEEEIFKIKAPQGLLIHGEVGSGKSMLMDLFAASLPHASKRRWHYHNFMLSIYARLYRETQVNQHLKHVTENNEDQFNLRNDYVLLKIAEELIDESAILLLDEFMLPDIAAAKIVKTLFTYFFKMGGVLVATSNRLPKELYAADFKKSQFRSFYDILQSRCVSYDMRSSNDWREILCAQSLEQLSESVVKRYWLFKEADEDWKASINKICGTTDYENEASTDSLIVYGRKLEVPWHLNGICKFDFEDLCDVPLAGADYISLASRYHTLILDNVPTLKLINKNQARRLITLLDALYECRTRLIIRAEAVADDLFFPDAKVKADGKALATQDDALELEMFSEVDLDLSSPYRPNVSSYQSTQMKQIFKEVDDTLKAEKNKDFTRASAFTGEDERFAYKRAISRLKEMTGSQDWWNLENWMPLDNNTRIWERPVLNTIDENITQKQGGTIGDYAPPDTSTEKLFRHGASPFRQHPDPPPKFSVAHFWSTVVWGAGKRRDERTRRWMRGNDAYRDTE
ncbi:AFG1-like ATPase-domain-containing protein [Dipodascopsis uninucleata]